MAGTTETLKALQAAQAAWNEAAVQLANADTGKAQGDALMAIGKASKALDDAMALHLFGQAHAALNDSERLTTQWMVDKGVDMDE
jgi:hypothetical protein